MSSYTNFRKSIGEYGPTDDWSLSMPVRDYDLAPGLCAIGQVGTPGTQTSGPAGPNNCQVPPTDGTTVIPVSAWKTNFDYYLGFERDRRLITTTRMMYTHNSVYWYDLGNNLDAYTQAWLATGDESYLTLAVELSEAIIGHARPSNLLDSFAANIGIWNDTYLSWEDYGVYEAGFRVPSGQAIQNEAQWAKHACYMAAKVKDDGGVTPALAARVDAIRDFIEVNIFEKWWVRAKGAIIPDSGNQILEVINHFDGYSRWASICMMLRYMAGSSSGLVNSANWSRLVTCSSSIVDGYVAIDGGTRGLRPHMYNHPDDSAAWWWPRLFSEGQTGLGDDIEHSNHLVRYIVDAVEFGMDGWTSTDLDRLKYTFTTILWDGDQTHPQTKQYMGAASPLVGVYWLQDGWFGLGRNDIVMHSIFQAKRPWSTNYFTQHYGQLMRNAMLLGA